MAARVPGDSVPEPRDDTERLIGDQVSAIETET
jgi:hypothetical protein